MAKALLLLVLVPLVLGQAGSFDRCLDVSWALPAVHDLIQYPLSLTTTVQQGVTNVWNVFQSRTSQWTGQLYYGLSNGDFFAVRNCHILEATMQGPYCGIAGTSFVAVVRHTATFGDNFRRIFAVDGQGNINVASPVGTETSSYNTTGRPWYITANGWSPPYLLFSGAGVASTFTASFGPGSGTYGGVVAADRTYREPCDACLMNSYAVPGATTLAQMGFQDWTGITQWSQIPPLIARIVSIMQQGNRNYAIALYMMLANNDYYEVIDCYDPTNSPGEYCQIANSRYIAGVRNDIVQPSSAGLVVPYAVTEAGVMSSTPTNINFAFPFTCTTSSFYQQGNGWTPVHSFPASSIASASGRTYTVAGYNVATGNVIGVAAADIAENFGSPCIGYIPSPCPS